ncbi:hypothetical protein MJH12_03270 [bacterium]|nr:hypothetical protein [bacterium]
MKFLGFFLAVFLFSNPNFAKELFTKELIFQRNLSNLKIKSSPLLMTSCGQEQSCSIQDNVLSIKQAKNLKTYKIPTKKAHHLIHHDHFLYISDTLLNNVLKFDLKNNSFDWLLQKKQLNYPKELAINAKDSQLFVADYGNLKISSFNPFYKEDKFFLYRDPTSNELAAPSSISIFQDFLFALYPAEQKLIQFHLKTTEILEEYDLQKNPLKLFSKASQVNIDLYGFIYIFDRPKKNIVVLNQQFELQDKLLQNSYFYPKIKKALSFNIDSNGNLYLQTKKAIYLMKIKNEELLLQKLKFHYRNSDLKTIIALSKKLLKTYPQNKSAREFLLEALELQATEYIRIQDWDMASFTLKETLKISPSHKSSLKKLRIISFKKNRNWILEIFFGISLLMIFLIASYTLFEYLFTRSKEPQE